MSLIKATASLYLAISFVSASSLQGWCDTPEPLRICDLMLSGAFGTSLSLGSIEEVLASNQWQNYVAKFIKTQNVGPSIEDLLITNNRVELKKIPHTINAFKDITWSAPAAEWYVEYLALENESSAQRRIKFNDLVDALSKRLAAYQNSFEPYIDNPFKWLEQRGKIKLSLKAYLMFVPVLLSVLKDQERGGEYEKLWLLLSGVRAEAGYILQDIPRIMEDFGAKNSTSKPFDTLFDAPVRDILNMQEWIEEAGRLLSSHRVNSDECM